MEIRYPVERDIEALKQVWQVCFQDSRDYIDFYFDNAYKSQNTLICTDGNKMAAMLTMLPAILNTATHIHKGVYIYAVATMPDYRRLGCMSKLEEVAEEITRHKDQDFMTLVPQTPPLFDLYQSLGYQPCFSLAHKQIQVRDYKRYYSGSNLNAVTGEYFKTLRQLYVSSLKFSVQFDGNMQEYLYQELKKTGYDMLAVQNKFGHGHIIYKYENNSLLIREVGLNRDCFNAAVIDIGKHFKVSSMEIKTIIGFESGMTQKPYGMIKFLDKHISLPKLHKPYMNLMLD